MLGTMKKSTLLTICICALIIAVGSIIALIPNLSKGHSAKLTELPTAGASDLMNIQSSDNVTQKQTITLDDDGLRDEKSIYSFLQGPVAWQKRYNWSGNWGELYTEEGAFFGGFGCGLCCIANIYDTLSPYEASPLEVYNYAKDNSSYYPTSENSAISWEAMLSTLKHLGMDAELDRKPQNYETFQDEMLNSETAIILVLSNDVESYWGETPGHYVNIWRYNQNDESVFVANPGANSKNRKNITLKECYDYLKEASNYQVLYVRGYDEAADEWKHPEAVEGEWIRPDYCPKKK